MATATHVIHLKDKRSHTRRSTGRVFKKGEKVELSNPEEIAYYKRVAGFSVTKLKKKAAAPTPPPVQIEEPEEAGDADEEAPI